LIPAVTATRENDRVARTRNFLIHVLTLSSVEFESEGSWVIQVRPYCPRPRGSAGRPICSRLLPARMGF
jgi:hypothetical protein